MNELQRLAEAELVWLELGAELAYGDKCEAFVEGQIAELPDPGEYGLSEAAGCEVAAETARAVFARREEAALAANWYDEAAAAYEQVLKIA